MKQGKIISLTLLSLFIFSALVPYALAKINFSDNLTITPAKVYQQSIFDNNGDKIEDKLMNSIVNKGEYSLDVVLIYDHKITSSDRLRLSNLGISFTNDMWDFGRRIHISTLTTNLNLITSLPGLSFIASAEKRTIFVGIEGTDFSDLAALEKYENTKIFWGIGCASIQYYSGIENDINKLGSYSMIADITDSKISISSYSNENTYLKPLTQDTAEIINATGMWDLGYEGLGVKVGNIDTGVNDQHPAFTGRIIDAYSFIRLEYGYDEEDLTTTDPVGHGSHTSGIILGDGSGTPADIYIGIAPQADLYFAKVGNPATSLSIIAAIDWLVNTKKVDCINLSFGGSDSVGVDALELAFSNAVRSKKVLASISAGNEGDTGYYTAGSPGTCDDVITVGALDTSHTPPYTAVYYTAKGLSADDHMKPDVLAPGYQIYSCDRVGDGYVSMGGTSMAAPHVTGAIALLIHACKNQGIVYNPGLIKAALMKTCTRLSGVENLIQARGFVNVGAAWDFIIKADVDLNNNIPLVGACNPIQQPVKFWETLVQGQVTEQYLTCVSPHKVNKTLEVTGTATPFVTIGSFSGQWTDIVKVTYKIPLNASVGTYTGQLAFKYEDTTLDTVNIEIDVEESLGKRMLLNFRTTDYSIDHMYGQYEKFSQAILNSGYVISEQLAYLDSGILNDYECVWLPDPFNYDFPEAYNGNYSYVTTYNPWTEGEKTALTNYVENGGTVFLAFLGQTETDIDGYGTIITNTNVTALNEWTEQWGIHVRDTIWTAPSSVVVGPKGYHALTADVTGIDHYGTSLQLSGDALQITEITSGSASGSCAVYQHESGGRVIVLTTNFCLDRDGFQNKYHSTATQNNVFGLNLVRWALAEHRMTRDSITNENGNVTLTYQYLSGPGADFGGFVIAPNLTSIPLTWSETSTDVWEAGFQCTDSGTYKFYPECGSTGLDDFDYYVVEYTAPTTSTTPPVSINYIIVILITSIGLAGWYLLQKKK